MTLPSNQKRPELELLFEQARAGKMDPSDFCSALEKEGIHGVKKLPLVIEAFNLSFRDAKDIVIRFDTGSSDAWAEEIADVIDELPDDPFEKTDNIGGLKTPPRH